MQWVDTERPGGSKVGVVGPSLALDLSWCIHGLYSDYLREVHPVLASLYDENGELCQQVRDFWADGLHCFPEIQVLAHHADAIEETSFEILRARCESALPSAPLDLRLASETEADRSTILSRIAQLQRSTTLRRKYFDLLAGLWKPVDHWWETEGVSSITASVSEMRRSLSRGSKWHQLVTSECAAFMEHYPEIVARYEGGSPVVLAACALFGKGLYLDLPDCILVGFGVGGAGQVARTRTEHVVRPLRALSDPTRLAIFEYLTRGSAGVTDIADAFSLSQPTVSVHIKRLREAGLVVGVRRGNRLELTVDSSTAETLANDLGGLLTQRPGPLAAADSGVGGFEDL